MYLADRMDRRQIDHVETHVCDSGQALAGGGEGAVHGLAVAVPTAGRAGKQFVPGREPCLRTVHPNAELVTAGDQFAKRIVREKGGHLGGQGRARPGERVTWRAQGLRRFDQRVAHLARDAGGGAVEQSGADQQVVVQFGFALARLQFGGDVVPPGADRVAPAVHPERPEAGGVGRELTVEDVRGASRRHRELLRFDPR